MLEIVRNVQHHFNKRPLNYILNSLNSEYRELIEEIDLVNESKPAGDDGVIGEAVDMISCLLDMILQVNPNISSSELNDILSKKCDKWVRLYGNN